MLLVSGATPTVMNQRHNPHLGVLMSPRGGHSVDWLRCTGLRWAADNDAFKRWDPPQFLKALERWRDTPGCLFICAPDVWGDAVATMVRFHYWEPIIRSYGLPVALVAQDGIERLKYIPWPHLDALFIGGSNRWRASSVVPQFIQAAHQRGKWVHWGRINIGSVRIAQYRGVDSFDGSGFSRQPSRIPRALEILRRAELAAGVAR
jgi:hypothetical protein